MVAPLLISVPTLVSDTKRMASDGQIDDPSNLAKSRVYLYSGTKDTTVVQGEFVFRERMLLSKASNLLS